jgi:rod shape-determining protein MreB
VLFELIRGFFSKDLLVELSEAKVSIKVFECSELLEYEPYIAIENTKKGLVIKAIGESAKLLFTENIRVVNPFKHARSFVADFALAEKLLQYGIYTIHNCSILRPAPRVVIHQLEKTEGGLTDIEDRVLRELALGTGAREVVIYLGDKIDVTTQSFDKVKIEVTS